jgi:hypothetical protein
MQTERWNLLHPAEKPRKAYLTEHDDCQVSFNDHTNRRNYVSHVFNVGGQELYRNKAGRCIDAPCCGCCTV